jgi:hypothetical protein
MTYTELTPKHGCTVTEHTEGIGIPTGVYLAILQQFEFKREKLIDLKNISNVSSQTDDHLSLPWCYK